MPQHTSYWDVSSSYFASPTSLLPFRPSNMSVLLGERAYGPIPCADILRRASSVGGGVRGRCLAYMLRPRWIVLPISKPRSMHHPYARLHTHTADAFPRSHPQAPMKS